MASPLAEAHIEAERRLRVLIERGITSVWRSLPAYDRANVEEWLQRVLPLVLAGQRQSAALTEAYLSRALDRPASGVDVDALIGAGLRNGAPPDEVYQRPFVTVWTALKNGTAYEDAVNAGLARATSAGTMDVQLAMRSTADAVQASGGIYGFRRAADAGACQFCQLVDGAYVKSASAMPLHNHCGCGLEPLTSPHPLAAKLPSGVAVHEHGELGPLLTDPADHFTPESAI